MPANKICPEIEREILRLKDENPTMPYREIARQVGVAQSTISRVMRDSKKNLLKCKTFTNPDLASFTPRELIEELKARGYTGELKYTHTIIL